MECLYAENRPIMVQQTNTSEALLQINIDGGIYATTSDGSADDMAYKLGAMLGMYVKHTGIPYRLEELLLVFEHGVNKGTQGGQL